MSLQRFKRYTTFLQATVKVGNPSISYFLYELPLCHSRADSYTALRPDSITISLILRDFKVDLKQISSPGQVRQLMALPATLGLNVIASTRSSPAPRTRPVAQLWASALKAAPVVAQEMWPPNPLNVQKLDLTSINSSAPITSTLLDRGLLKLMSDIPTFLAFTSNGSFAIPSQAIVPIADTSTDLSIGVNTFITSKLMESQGFYAVPGEIMDVTAFNASENGCTGPVGTLCTTRDWRMVYWSPTTHRSYKLLNKGTSQITYEVLMDGVNVYRFADLELLFDGAYNCTRQGRAGTAIVDVGGLNGTAAGDGGVDGAVFVEGKSRSGISNINEVPQHPRLDEQDTASQQYGPDKGQILLQVN
ncbi:MAG: hypothetical protein Q9171_006266 [Xanthocarpia ochracea]